MGMKSDRIEVICNFPSFEVANMPRQEFDQMIKTKLASEIAKGIVNTLSKMPVTHKLENLHDVERHTVWLNIISDDELERLMEYQRTYQDLLDKYSALLTKPFTNK